NPVAGVSRVPEFEVSGEVSNATATAVLLEWGPAVDGPWRQVYLGPPTTEKIPVTGMQPETQYFIAISYIRNQNQSERQVYGPYIAPPLVANDTVNVDGVPAGDVAAQASQVPVLSSLLQDAQDAIATHQATLYTATSGLVDKTAAILDSLNTPTTGVLARLQAVETAESTSTSAAVSRLNAIEATVNTPGSGLTARMVAQETATTNLTTGKADVSRVSALEAQVQTAGTGLIARMAAQESATVNLQTGKADASRVAVLEARGSGSNMLKRSQFFAAADIAGWVNGNAGVPSYSAFVEMTNGWALDGEKALKLTGAPGGVNYAEISGEAVPVRVGDRLCVQSYQWGYLTRANLIFYLYDANGAYIGLVETGEFEGGNYGTALASWTLRYAFGTVPAGAVFGVPTFRIYAAASAPQTIYAMFLRPMVSVATATQTEPPPWAPAAIEGRAVQLEARASALETATTNLATGKADAARVTTLEARAGGSNLLTKSQFVGAVNENVQMAPWTFGGDMPAVNAA
ncbi:MAG: hypothetical protein Q8R97_10780, partial [Brevundimonas sp.]|nr:hypothetical protein [Brevundimonas sp.]